MREPGNEARFVLQQDKLHSDKNKTKQDKTSLPQGTQLSTPGDRLHKHRQAFPWHPSWSTRGQTTNMTDKSSHGTHFYICLYVHIYYEVNCDDLSIYILQLVHTMTPVQLSTA